MLRKRRDASEKNTHTHTPLLHNICKRNMLWKKRDASERSLINFEKELRTQIKNMLWRRRDASERSFFNFEYE